MYALESAHIEQEVAAQVEQELKAFTRLRREGVDPATSRLFTDVAELIELFLNRNVPDDDQLLVGYWDEAPRLRSGQRDLRRSGP